MLAYFDSIFGKDVKSTAIKEQLDEILNKLVNDYDEEEAPLRKQERVEQLTLDCDGDLERVRKKMQIEQTAFEQSKNFTQLLTDAAMKPESSHVAVSTQKVALALSKEWILSCLLYTSSDGDVSQLGFDANYPYGMRPVIKVKLNKSLTKKAGKVSVNI